MHPRATNISPPAYDACRFRFESAGALEIINDYLPSHFKPITLDELRDMFVFLGIGFIALCLVFIVAPKIETVS